MSIKYGLFLSNQYPPETDTKQNLEDIIEQVHRAKQSGFHSLWAGQHFLTKPLQMLQAIPLLARLASEAEGMVLGTNILVLPLLNPVAVAEESATMDYITGGRFVLGIGLGYRDEEFQVFNVDKSKRVSRFTEAIELIRKFWSQDTVSFEGKHFSIPDVGLGLKPIQEGGPPIWIGASVERAIQRAAKYGDAWLITFYPSITLLTEQMDIYKTSLKAAGKPVPTDMPILRECYIGESKVSALEECRAAIMTKYASYASWNQDSFLPDSEKFDQPFDQFMNDRFIIGDPVYVREEIQRYRDLIGVDHFILRMQWPGLDQDKVLKSIDLLGEKVIPYVK